MVISFPRKRASILILITISLIFVIPFTIYLLDRNFSDSVKGTDTLTNDVNSQLLKFSEHFNHAQVKEALDRISDKSIPKKERYEALKDLSFYFASAYSSSHNPELRRNSEIVKTFAAKNFPEYYKDESGIFELTCSDPLCGDRPDEELRLIHDEVKKLKVTSEYLGTINYNLEQAIYIPRDNIDEKMYGFELAVSQLEILNNNEASAAAKKLRDYLQKKYSLNFDD